MNRLNKMCYYGPAFFTEDIWVMYKIRSAIRCGQDYRKYQEYCKKASKLAKDCNTIPFIPLPIDKYPRYRAKVVDLGTAPTEGLKELVEEMAMKDWREDEDE